MISPKQKFGTHCEVERFSLRENISPITNDYNEVCPDKSSP